MHRRVLAHRAMGAAKGLCASSSRERASATGRRLLAFQVYEWWSAVRVLVAWPSCMSGNYQKPTGGVPTEFPLDRRLCC
jgi:hypothetical protein